MKVKVYRPQWESMGDEAQLPPVVHALVTQVKIVGSIFVVELTNGETVFWPSSSVDRIETDHSGT